jgi:hypothetical protein
MTEDPISDDLEPSPLTRTEIEQTVAPIVSGILNKLFEPGAQLVALTRAEVEAALIDTATRVYRLALAQKRRR